MEKLSDEILLRIFSFLSAKDLCRCSQVGCELFLYYHTACPVHSSESRCHRHTCVLKVDPFSLRQVCSTWCRLANDFHLYPFY